MADSWWRTTISTSLVLFMLGTDSAKLARIEFQVVFLAFLLLLSFVLDLYRHRSRSAAVKCALLVLDAASESMKLHVIGLIQNAPFNNEFFPVWAILLVTLDYSIDFISSSASRRRHSDFFNVLMIVSVVNLASSEHIQFKGRLWLLWSLNPVKVLVRIVLFALAKQKSEKNTMWVAAYMMYEHTLTTTEEPCNPSDMRGYKYLVQGEDKQIVDAAKPDYLIQLTIKRDRKLITLEKIWQCQGRLLQSSWGDPNGRLKDTCLSFALCKLLRLRFYDINIAEAEEQLLKSEELVFRGILGEEDEERVFRITEMELAFVNDFFYTRYPVIFSNGLPIADLLLNFVTVDICVWIAAGMSSIFEPRNKDEVMHFLHRVNVDVVITWGLLTLIFLKETWQMAAYLFSDWTKVVLLSSYVERPYCQRNALVDNLYWLLCRYNLVNRWHNKMGQYNFLQSFSYKPRLWNLLSFASLGSLSQATDGGKQSREIELPKQVKKAIVRSLRLRAMPGISSSSLRLLKEYQVKTKSEAILVWHIATCLCEIELYKQFNTNSISSCFKDWCCCCCCCCCCWNKEPFLVKLEKLEEELRSHYVVANAISRYSAYLLVFCPELLPDENFLPEFVFESAVSEAKEILGGCDSLESIYKKLMEEEKENVVKMGAKLGKELMLTIDDEITRWKMLADIWVELLLSLAPTDNINAHKSSLATGGEFITHLWALLSHAGITSTASSPFTVYPGNSIFTTV